MRPGCSCSREALCDPCLATSVEHLAGAAMLRGELWARRAIDRGRDRRRPWPAHEGKAAARAREIVADLALDPRVIEQLAAACTAQAARTWSG